MWRRLKEQSYQRNLGSRNFKFFGERRRPSLKRLGWKTKKRLKEVREREKRDRKRRKVKLVFKFK